VRLIGGTLVYTLNRDVAFREVDGSILLVNLKSGFYYSLNGTATFVYRLLNQNKGIPEILLEMCAAYDVPEDTARRDLEECLETLVREQVLLTQGG